MKQVHKIKRRISNQIFVGDVAIGGGAPISVQSMTNTNTCDVDSTVLQIESLKKAAEKMQAIGSLVMPVQEMPPPIGWIFMAKDPDGNTLEFSFDQGVYATFQELAE